MKLINNLALVEDILPEVRAYLTLVIIHLLDRGCYKVPLSINDSDAMVSLDIDFYIGTIQVNDHPFTDANIAEIELNEEWCRTAFIEDFLGYCLVHNTLVAMKRHLPVPLPSEPDLYRK